MLTKELLMNLKPMTIFATGIVNGFKIVGQDRLLRYIAIRGGYHDWALYYGDINESDEEVARSGMKIHGGATIKELVPCDEQAFNLYRH